MIFNYESVDEFLKDELSRRTKSNSRYSLRSFARNLGVSPGALSEVLRGQRPLSLKVVPRIAKAIGLNATEGRHLLQLVQKAKALKNKDVADLENHVQTRDEHALSEEVFNLISEWHHFAILSLTEVDGFQWNAVWIARRLGISRLQAQMAMDLLLRLQLIEKRAGTYQGRNSSILSTQDIPSQAIRAYHRKMLEMAIEALDTQAVENREISGSGFALDPAHLPLLKKEIAQFQDRLIAKYSKGKKSEVYFLEMALFKLTQENKR